MVVDARGDVVVTNDGATILKQIQAPTPTPPLRLLALGSRWDLRWTLGGLSLDVRWALAKPSLGPRWALAVHPFAPPLRLRKSAADPALCQALCSQCGMYVLPAYRISDNLQETLKSLLRDS